MTPGQVYREGANKGVIVGVYLSVIFLCAVLSDYVPLLSLLAILLMLGVPFFIYRIMNFIYKKYQRVADFSSLWMLGISLFLGGSLICSLVTYATLEYALPDYIYNQAEKALELYQQMPQIKDSELTKYIKTAIENGLLPTPIEFAIEMLWLTSFSGSMLSLLLAAIIRAFNNKQN